MTDTSGLLQTIARHIDNAINGSGEPKRNGFVLLTFPFTGEPGPRVNYVSNTDRTDIIAALREISARLEGQAFEKGNA